MQIISRKMESTINQTQEYGTVQASFNSDGRIVLRCGYSSIGDQIFVFSKYETEAIISLFKRIKQLSDDLPF